MGTVEMARAGTLICKYYKKALQAWSRRHSKGELLCLDCLNSAKELTSHLTHNERLLDSSAHVALTKNERKVGQSAGQLESDKEKEEISDDKSIVGEYLEMIPSEMEATAITKLGDVSVYLPKIMNGGECDGVTCIMVYNGVRLDQILL